MFTNPEDWHQRLKNTGGTVILSADAMGPGRAQMSTEGEVIWNEIQGNANRHRWRQVHQYFRRIAGQFNGTKEL